MSALPLGWSQALFRDFPRNSDAIVLALCHPAPMAIDDIKALTFDVFGTVVDWRSGVIRDAAAIGAAHGIEADWAAFAAEWRSLYDPGMEEVRTGRRDWVRLDVLHRESLEKLLPRYGLAALPEADVDWLNACWHRLDPWPDVIEGLTRLRTKFTLVTLSNGNIALMVNMAKRAGLPWDAVLGAEAVKLYKPDPEAYTQTAELLGLLPEQCMMVAAHPRDLDAAAATGFRTAYVHRPQEYPERPRNVVPAGRYDFVAADMLDLASQFGC